MKATEQYFPVVLFITLYKVVLSKKTLNKILIVTFQIKVIYQHFRAMLITFYKLFLTFEYMNEALKCERSN